MGCENGNGGMWYTAQWFDWIQPQLCFATFYGQRITMTMQDPGDIIYVPSMSKHSAYAVQDSFSVTRKQLTLGGLEHGFKNVDKEYLHDSSLDRLVLAKSQERYVEWEETVEGLDGSYLMSL